MWQTWLQHWKISLVNQNKVVQRESSHNFIVNPQTYDVLE